MAPNFEARLKHLYSFTEGFECQGKCQSYCGPVPFSKTEAELSGICGHQPFNADLMCNSLSPLGTCTIYENRPLICRMFGAVDTPLLRCPHGCKPVLTELEGRNLSMHYNEIMREEAQCP